MLLYSAVNKSAQSVGVGNEGDEGEKAWITREGVGELMSFLLASPCLHCIDNINLNMCIKIN